MDPRVHRFRLSRRDGFLWACKKSLVSVNEMLARKNFLTSFIHSSYLLPYDFAGRISGEFLWMSEEFSPAGNISLWSFMLIYHLGKEQ
jgi:hypothetical protein